MFYDLFNSLSKLNYPFLNPKKTHASTDVDRRPLTVHPSMEGFGCGKFPPGTIAAVVSERYGVYNHVIEHFKLECFYIINRDIFDD